MGAEACMEAEVSRRAEHCVLVAARLPVVACVRVEWRLLVRRAGSALGAISGARNAGRGSSSGTSAEGVTSGGAGSIPTERTLSTAGTVRFCGIGRLLPTIRETTTRTG